MNEGKQQVLGMLQANLPDKGEYAVTYSVTGSSKISIEISVSDEIELPFGYRKWRRGDKIDHVLRLVGGKWEPVPKKIMDITGFSMQDTIIIPDESVIMLSNHEKMAGIKGPPGFRLQKFMSKIVKCCMCEQYVDKDTIHARWRSNIPGIGELDETCGAPQHEKNHLYAHVDCLFSQPGKVPESLTVVPVPATLASKVANYWLQRSKNPMLPM